MRFLPILLMALITYIIRVLPMAAFQKKIKSPFIQAFLHYIPYCILTAMIIPSIFYSTQHTFSALIGTAIALILAWFEKSLLVVSMSAVFFAYLAEILIHAYF